MITMLRTLLLSAVALLLCMPRTAAADVLSAGPVFDAHLHYNEDAAAAYPVDTAFELFSKNGVKAVDGTRALFESKRKDIKVVPFIRVYRNRADYGTWFNN